LLDALTGVVLNKAREWRANGNGIHDNQYKNISLESLKSNIKSCSLSSGFDWLPKKSVNNG
jgi:hypothetical protein